MTNMWNAEEKVHTDCKTSWLSQSLLLYIYFNMTWARQFCDMTKAPPSPAIVPCLPLDV